jgi:hypothetical protein
MKPFDLQKALAGEPVITRDGRPVKIAGYNKDAREGSSIAGWVGGRILCWYTNGSYSTDFTCKHGYDLFMAPTERKEWVVRVANPTDHTDSFIAGPYKTYDFAKDVFNSKREGWATIHEITITE